MVYIVDAPYDVVASDSVDKGTVLKIVLDLFEAMFLG